jgi:GT2 family glycosyltransferase
MIERVADCDNVSEVIVISNAPDNFKPIPKVKLITPSENLFVNPSWNLGYAISEGEFLCIMNDDITFDAPRVFKEVELVAHVDPYAIIGAGGNAGYVKECKARPHGWGIFMFMHRNAYNWIPNDLKVSYGDDWLFESTEARYAAPMRWFETEMSTTSREPWAIEQAERDEKTWRYYAS